jgi:D-sedoheptulose 7-phosphate isomerase
MNAPWRRAFPVIPLMTDIATLTAISNDIDYARVFVNQLRLLGQPGDMALVVSTSGKSPNLVYALEEARERQMLTIAWAGKDGGRFPELADYCFIVPSYSIHRIQEVHATLVHIAWDLIHIALGAEDVVRGGLGGWALFRGQLEPARHNARDRDILIEFLPT